MLTRRTAVAALAISAALAGLGGCVTYKPGGDGRSIDTFTYVSDALSPKTVTLLDLRTGETLWTYEVPVGRQLVVRFYENKKDAVSNMPDIMRWDEMPAGKKHQQLRNLVNVPPAGSRRVDMTIRSIPEHNAEATPPSASAASY